jgi:hypothetical protein
MLHEAADAREQARRAYAAPHSGENTTLNFSHIWTHPALQGQCRVTARKITTARIYTACHMENTCALPALMDSALFLLNSLTASDGLCEKQDLEEPV